MDFTPDKQNPATPLADGSAAPATTPAADAPAPFDSAAYAARLKEIDPAWDLDNFVDQARNMRQTLSKQGQELHSVKQDFARVKPLLDATDQDEILRQRLDDAIRSHYEDAPSPGYRSMEPSRLTSAIDPVQRELGQLKTDVVTMRMESELTNLESQGFPLNEERRVAIIQRVLETGWGSPRDHAMALYGDEWTKMKIEEAVRNATEAIQKNSNVYRPIGNTGNTVGSAAPKSPSQMSDKEWDDQAMNAIRERGMKRLPTIGGG